MAVKNLKQPKADSCAHLMDTTVDGICQIASPFTLATMRNTSPDLRDLSTIDVENDLLLSFLGRFPNLFEFQVCYVTPLSPAFCPSFTICNKLSVGYSVVTISWRTSCLFQGNLCEDSAGEGLNRDQLMSIAESETEKMQAHLQKVRPKLLDTIFLSSSL
jgi:hypothetical protein